MLNSLTTKKNIRSFSLSAENITGEKGKGAMCPVEEGTAHVAARELGVGWKVNPCLEIAAKGKLTLADISGQGVIKHIWITDTLAEERCLILRIYFDGHQNPAVEAPLSDFFAAAIHNEYRQLSSIAVCVNPQKAMNCYFEMPYFTGFRIEVENLSTSSGHIYYQIDCEEKELPEDTLYFHAQFRRQNPIPYKTPYTILDNVKGNGHYVGTYLFWGVKSNGWWGEGEIKFYIDGDGEYPTICGTGTEDYFCGSHNFDVKGKYTEFCTPYAGMYKVERTDETYQAQRYFNMYRWHVTDPIYFKNDLKVTIQALGWRSEGRYRALMDDISSVAYWYSDTLDDVYPTFPTKDELEHC